MSSSDVDAIAAASHSGEDPDGGGGVIVRLVPVDEVKVKGFDLNTGWHLKTAAAATLDLPCALANYDGARARRLDAGCRLLQGLDAAGMTGMDKSDG